MTDQQTALFLLLRQLTFPLSGKWGDFVDYSKFVQSMLLLFLLIYFKHNINFL